MTSYCNIPREVVHKYVSMCKFCQKSHACFIPLNVMKKQKKQQKKNEMAFLTRCQVILFLFSFLSNLISIRNTLQSGKIITLQWLVHTSILWKKLQGMCKDLEVWCPCSNFLFPISTFCLVKILIFRGKCTL